MENESSLRLPFPLFPFTLTFWIMSIVVKIKHTVRGDITLRTFVLEAVRRIRVLRARRREREQLAQLAQPARLCESFARMTASELLAHFQSRATPECFPGF